ncbi:hypothetical protein JCM21714_237 [Gracilibacillus boraciitolerans JCM 21714]|uniref:Core domain-containing protein n=1 Tax=Gracilibacillus boraciitolerans JCM 21714 TaxID=1298598 RepID=W4VDN0_9BACI|nr:iron-sulfur cluster biosynthesis family protein [Gracilibacillus boraciitolerans]GAE91291.1 hypothetical protein JCM21714_237 [Gracilibacillus boraciitolerans JCM 21714]
MELMITNQALDKLTELDSSRLMILALTYDTEGCGCGVNGMPTFALITKKQRNHIDVMCKDREVVVDKMESVFFAEK